VYERTRRSSLEVRSVGAISGPIVKTFALVYPA